MQLNILHCTGQTEKDLAPNTNSAEVEETWMRVEDAFRALGRRDSQR